MDYLENLNEKQAQAVLCTEGPLLIIAGAGSGKTTTMTRRIAYLVGEKGVEPYRILAVTFTNKAANEMRERIEGVAGTLPGMWVLTFHAACLRILRKHIHRLGYETDFTIYDTTDQKTVIKECLSEEGLSEKEYATGYVLSLISRCKNRGQSPEEFRQEAAHFREETVADLYRRYMDKLRKYNALDFDDLLLKTVRLFQEHPDVLREYSERFQYIMIDEYQDTNEIQYQIVRMLAQGHGNICAVGDEDQCIYEWRGATIRNILEFEEDFPGGKLIKLEQNYRSCGNILGGANAVIENNFSRKGKRLWTDKEMGEKIRYVRLGNDKEESFYISREIHKMIDQGYHYKDIAVLYRTHVQSRSFEESFSGQDVPYRVLGGTRFYDRKEIKDILSYMRLIQNNRDDIAFQRVINEPRRGVGDKTMEKLQMLAQVSGHSIFEELQSGAGMEVLSGKAAVSVGQFVKMVQHFSQEKSEKKISDIYEELLRETGYWQSLEAQETVEAAGRMENLQEFKSVIYDFEHENPQGSYEEFLEKIALLTDIDNRDETEDAVVLMTMHSAKGLEFPIVFMPGMEEETFPGRRAETSDEELEEERRLCYVGMTRAQELLYMTGAESRLMYGRIEARTESRFIGEIRPEHLDRAETESRRGILGGRRSSSLGDGAEKTVDQHSYMQQQRTAILDPAKVRKKTRESEEWEAYGGFTGGEKVRHKKFGTGMVVGVKADGEDTMITVIFDEVGVKVLDANIVKLQRV